VANVTETFLQAVSQATGASHVISGVTIPAGKLAVLRMVYGSESRTITSVVDSAGNTWSQALNKVGTGLGCSYSIWYCVLTNPLSAGTITTTISAAGATWGADLAYFDSDTGWLPQASVLDVVKSNAVNNNANWTTGATPARTQAEEIGVGGCHRINVNGGTSTPVAGWTEESERAVTNVETNNKLVSQWQKFSATGTDACAGTWSAAEYWVCGVATFKMAAGGTPPAETDNFFAFI